MASRPEWGCQGEFFATKFPSSALSLIRWSSSSCASDAGQNWPGVHREFISLSLTLAGRDFSNTADRMIYNHILLIDSMIMCHPMLSSDVSRNRLSRFKFLKTNQLSGNLIDINAQDRISAFETCRAHEANAQS